MPWPWRERLWPLRMGSIVQMPVSNSELTSFPLVKALLVGATGFDL